VNDAARSPVNADMADEMRLFDRWRKLKEDRAALSEEIQRTVAHSRRLRGASVNRPGRRPAEDAETRLDRPLLAQQPGQSAALGGVKFPMRERAVMIGIGGLKPRRYR
jgi:hypothetical protein